MPRQKLEEGEARRWGSGRRTGVTKSRPRLAGLGALLGVSGYAEPAGLSRALPGHYSPSGAHCSSGGQPGAAAGSLTAYT